MIATDIEFITVSEEAIKRYIDENIEYDHNRIYVEVYAIWYQKTMQYWKGLFISNISNDAYYEVTISHSNNELTLDIYKKLINN